MATNINDDEHIQTITEGPYTSSKPCTRILIGGKRKKLCKQTINLNVNI